MLFVRHGPRDRDNHSPAPERLDGTIMTNVYPHTDLLHDYVDRHGVPRRIVSSPYQRTRGTAKLLQDFLRNEYDIDVSIEIEVRIGEYLGGAGRVMDHDFHPSTLHHRPIRDRNRSSFLRRAFDFKSERGVWYVSHSYYISSHLERYGVSIPSKDIPVFHAILFDPPC